MTRRAAICIFRQHGVSLSRSRWVGGPSRQSVRSLHATCASSRLLGALLDIKCCMAYKSPFRDAKVLPVSFWALVPRQGGPTVHQHLSFTGSSPRHRVSPPMKTVSGPQSMPDGSSHHLKMLCGLLDCFLAKKLDAHTQGLP